MKVSSYNKNFFLHLVSGLQQNSINYCIIGDYANLPESVKHDIDIWTDNIKGFRSVLFKAIHQTGHHICIDNRTANGCNVAFYKRVGNELTFMKIDVMKDTAWKSILTLVDKETTSASVLPYKDFFIMNPEGEALGHLLYPLFEWGFIKKDNYKHDIKEHCKSEIFHEALKKLWGEKIAHEVITLIETDDWDGICKRIGRLRCRALIRGLWRTDTWKNFFSTLYYSILRLAKPSGKCLAFCGLDGAGKTTIIDELNYIFVNLLKKKKVYYGYWRPFVLPEIRELFGKKNSKAGIDKDSQKGKTIIEPERKPKNKLLSLVKLVYYWIDYVLAPFKYGGIRSRGGIVLFDRHYVDMAVHPQRFEMNISQKIILALYRLIPKADYTFFLYCTPEEILQRKQEFTAEEISQQTEMYMKVGKKIKDFVPIHTNKSIAEEIDEVLSHITIQM